MAQTFKTEFINQTEFMIRVFDNGNYLMLLSSNWRVTLESATPLSDFARYSSVKWIRSGILPLLETRAGWVEPDRGRWVTTFCNIDGAELEQRDIGDGQKIHLQVGIPIIRAVPLSSRFVFAKRVDIKRVYDKKSSFSFPGYLSAYDELRDVFEFRPESERQQILLEIKALEQPQKNVAEAEQKFQQREKI